MGLERINQFKKELNVTNEELATRSKVPKSTVDKITSGHTSNPSLETIKAIVYALGKTLDDLDESLPLNLNTGKNITLTYLEKDHIKKYRTLDEHGKKIVDFVIDEECSRMEAQKTNIHEPTETYETKTLNFQHDKAAAGSGFDLSDGSYDVITVIKNIHTQDADFCLQITGDSMEPHFRDGNIVLVKERPDIEYGQIGIWIINNQGYIKKKGEDRLISLNPDFADVRIGEFDDMRCVGRVFSMLDPAWIVG